MMNSEDTLDSARFKRPLIMMIIFWIIAVVLWQTTGLIFYRYNFGYIGIALGIGLGLYRALPKKQKRWGTRLAQFLLGTCMLVFLSLLQRENMQIKGFFFYLLAGFFAGSVIHYLVTKIAGPLVFNRGWCGWACWTAMVLDLLPYIRNNRGRLAGKWGYLRYIHFVLGLRLVAVLWWGLNYRVQEQSLTELYWLLGGNILYYAVGIALAYVLQDNREFCMYICPIPTLRKITSRFALVKIGGYGEKCKDCGTCNKMCPMDIRVSEYVLVKQRVLSPSVFCALSASTCARKAHWILHSNSILAIASC